MVRWVRAYWDDEDEWHWFELDDECYAMRHVVLRGGEVITAANLDEVTAALEGAGVLGVQLYEAIYGILAEGALDDLPEDAISVTKARFDSLYRSAARTLTFRPVTTGPIPVGHRVVGAFETSPWAPGNGGVPVNLGTSVGGFVDWLWFYDHQASWPEPGVEAEFEVVQISARDPQIRLRPVATPSDDGRWPERHDWDPARPDGGSHDWKKAVSLLRRVRATVNEHVAEADRWWPATEPRLPGAAPGTLAALPGRLGRDLDSGYLSLLAEVDGWPAVLEDVDLFGTAELLGPEYGAALDLLRHTDPDVLDGSGIDVETAVPIGAAPHRTDLFVLSGSSSIRPSSVVWLAGYEIERWDDFPAFIRGLTANNRAWLATDRPRR